MGLRRKFFGFKAKSRKNTIRDKAVIPNPRGPAQFRTARRCGVLRTLAALIFGGLLVGPVALDAASLLWRESAGCKVWLVIDGDTVKMYCPDEGFVSGRLLRYDTPEMKARCPKELASAVAATFVLRWHLWTARDVYANPRERDRYDRVLTMMVIDGEQAGRLMVNAGLARWYSGGPRKSWCN
ncbi:thermonuclease family protein [Primorskyibacter aestuariivivens]|uniref:thermonuclease family protein n=1 Tax=Primorskyibacter aestuariivivens TaxID=1888912 RepID=UPI00230110F3|nr:thermonuclease family protein [Primorskyibacter aestuariivivens]MDA7428712.1 thermonuclease family protein [Primorskyibacter aestuariivivens]